MHLKMKVFQMYAIYIYIYIYVCVPIDFTSCLKETTSVSYVSVHLELHDI